MANQSMLQNFIQNTAGTQTTAQANTPSATNNGNPNTAYNWTSYLPSVTQGAGGLPNVNFSLLSSQAPASSAGYTPPFTADPYAAMVMAGMPRAGSNDNVNRILSGFLGNGTGTGTSTGTFTPNPGTGTPTTPVTPPTGTPLPGSGVKPPVGAIGTPVGPISGPINQNPNALAANYANAQPRTSLDASGNGRWGQSDWMQTPEFQTAFNLPTTGNSIFDGLRTALKGVSNSLGGLIDRESDAFMQEVSGLMDDVTLKNGGAGLLRRALNIFGIPGLGDRLIPQREEEGFNLSPEQEAAITSKLNTQLSGMMQKITQQGGADALKRLENLGASSDKSKQYQAYYDKAPRMSNTDWNRTMDRAGFINMFAQGQANNTTSGMLKDLQDRFDRVAKTPIRRVQK